MFELADAGFITRRVNAWEVLEENYSLLKSAATLWDKRGEVWIVLLAKHLVSWRKYLNLLIMKQLNSSLYWR